MSISNADKTYWTEELKNALSNKILQVMRSKGDTTIFKMAKEKTRYRIIETLGLDNLIAERAELDRLEKEARKLSNDYNHQSNAILDQILAVLRDYKGKSNSDYHGYEGVDEILNTLVNRDLPNFLKESEDPDLVEIGRYYEAANSVERTLMLATSPTQLRNFLVSFAKKFGLELEGIDL